MEISYGDVKSKIKNIVQTKAKYQKVILLFDAFVSTIEIKEIYEEIKDICIYNQGEIGNIEEQELNNGYRVVIFLCCSNNFMKVKINKSEFINIFCPKDNGLLPFILSEKFNPIKSESYMLLEEIQVDAGLISSICCNEFLNNCNNLLTFNRSFINNSAISQDLVQFNLVKIIENLDNQLRFLDVEILTKCNISYEKIVLVDLILINAFIVLMQSIKNQSIALVDTYKATKENEELIDKFYSKYNNETFFSLIILNYNCLMNCCLNNKEKIISCLDVFNFSQEDVNEVVEKIKIFCKRDSGLFFYLYLYNIFDV